jgi:hypothetical protein
MKVVNRKNWDTHTVYIGRGSIFGNPFHMKNAEDDDERDYVCNMYRTYALNKPELLAAIDALKPYNVLGCFCAPKRCHGHEIIKLWEERRADENRKISVMKPDSPRRHPTDF